MDEAILQDLLVSLRCLISSALLISMSCALFDFRGVKKGKVFLFATLIALVGSALVGVAFHFSSPDYTLIAALYFPILTFCYAALFLWLFHDNVWYTLFVFALVATFYFLINVFSEIFLRILPSPYWSNGVYFSLRLLLIPVASALVHHFLHDRLLEDKKWIGKQFLYPCLLEVALFFLLLFVGAVPSAWYLRDPSIHWLLAYCGLFIPTVDLLIRRFIHNLIRQERRKEEEEEMRLKLEGMEKAIEAESLQKEKDAKARHDLHHHLGYLAELLQEGKAEEAERYLINYRQEISSLPHLVHTGNFALDSLVRRSEEKAKETGITFTWDIVVPSELVLRDSEVIALFANLLENALTGAKASGTKAPFVRFEGKKKKGFFAFTIANSSAPVLFKNDFPLRENGSEGLGCHNVADILNDHGGFLSFTFENGVFNLEAVLPLVPVPEGSQ